MSFISFKSRETVNVLISNINSCAKTIEDGFDMRTEASILKEISQDLGRGLFNILVMGKFKTGKSTLINALVGKSVMATKALACTAIIATVEYGTNIDQVRIVYKPESNRQSEIISVNRFARDFTIKQTEEQPLIKNGGRLNRFADVSHAEMFSTNKLFADGTRLIDSPGLEEDISRTTVTKQFLPRANAIVFTLDATALFSGKERKYISDNFAGKHMKNLFFVVNKINLVVPDQINIVKATVKQQLEDTFTDENGRFDEKLYNRRVFFVDAYGAECARTGTPYKVKVGTREFEVPIDLEDTDLPAFENELRTFLNSSERIDALVNSTLSVMKINRDNAVQKAAHAKELRETDMKQRKIKLQEAQKNLESAEKLLKNFSPPIKQATDEISTKAYSYFMSSVEIVADNFERRHLGEFAGVVNWGDLAGLSANFVRKGIDTVKKAGSFISDAISSRFTFTGSIGTFLGSLKKSAEPVLEVAEESLNTLEKNLDELANKSAKPIVEFMQEAIRRDLDSCIARMTDGIKLSDILDGLEKNLDRQAEQFDSRLEEVTTVKKSLRSALAMSNWNINFSGNSRQMTGTLPISFEWFGSIMSTVTTAVAVVVSAVWLFLMPILPVIIVGAIVYCVKEGLGPEDMKKKLLSMIVSETFDKLKEYIQSKHFEILENINESVLPLMTVQSEKITSTAQNLINDADRTLKNLVAEKFSDAATATERDEKNLWALAVQMDNVRGQLTRTKKSSVPSNLHS